MWAILIAHTTCEIHIIHIMSICKKKKKKSSFNLTSALVIVFVQQIAVKYNNVAYNL